jgi:hypothetical protein
MGLVDLMMVCSTTGLHQIKVGECDGMTIMAENRTTYF